MRILSKHKQLVYFILSGGAAASINFLSRIFLSLWMPFSVAIIVAYIFGMTVAFVLNRCFVFREATNPMHHQAMWFTIINLLAVLQTLAVSLLLARKLFPLLGLDWHRDLIAHAFGVATPILTSYVGHKRLSFKTS